MSLSYHLQITKRGQYMYKQMNKESSNMHWAKYFSYKKIIKITFKGYMLFSFKQHCKQFSTTWEQKIKKHKLILVQAKHRLSCHSVNYHGVLSNKLSMLYNAMVVGDEYNETAD